MKKRAFICSWPCNHKIQNIPKVTFILFSMSDHQSYNNHWGPNRRKDKCIVRRFLKCDVDFLRNPTVWTWSSKQTGPETVNNGRTPVWMALDMSWGSVTYGHYLYRKARRYVMLVSRRFVTMNVVLILWKGQISHLGNLTIHDLSDLNYTHSNKRRLHFSS